MKPGPRVGIKRGRRAYPVITFARPVPSCTTRAQYELWRAAATKANTGVMHDGFCTDCTQKYKYAMMQEGRCEHPEIKFREDDDGMIEGFSPREEA
jgi:hypothetical protein